MPGCAFTVVYVVFEWRFDQDSYEQLAFAGVPWEDVVHVLRGRQFRRLDGAVALVAGQGRDGTWLGVLLVEDGWGGGLEEGFLVVNARRLNEEESATIAQIMKGGPR
jgi:hypothetical protein